MSYLPQLPTKNDTAKTPSSTLYSTVSHNATQYPDYRTHTPNLSAQPQTLSPYETNRHRAPSP